MAQAADPITGSFGKVKLAHGVHNKEKVAIKIVGKGGIADVEEVSGIMDTQAPHPHPPTHARYTHTYMHRWSVCTERRSY